MSRFPLHGELWAALEEKDERIAVLEEALRWATSRPFANICTHVTPTPEESADYLKWAEAQPKGYNDLVAALKDQPK